MAKKEETKKQRTVKLMNNLEGLARRQEKFNEDQKIMKDSYMLYLDELRSLAKEVKFDINNAKVPESGLLTSVLSYLSLCNRKGKGLEIFTLRLQHAKILI